MVQRANKLAAIIALALILTTGKTWASTTTYTGCLYCKPVTFTGSAATCEGAPVDTEVGWVTCMETDLGTGLFTADPLCTTSGNPCIVTNAGGGSGGGGTGGGGDGCARGAGDVCEAECFSCGGGQRQ